MEIYKKFELIKFSEKEIAIAKNHALARTKHIIRQFVPRAAPSNPIESNYGGVLGELAIRKFLKIDTRLEENYESGTIDSGDIEFKNKAYDVKTDLVFEDSYEKIFTGQIKKYEKYGCRVFTQKHLHHLVKYTGGLIFCVFRIPNNAKDTREDSGIRKEYLSNNSILIIGYVERDKILEFKPSLYGPKNPETNKSVRYNSVNFQFHHTDLYPISNLLK